MLHFAWYAENGGPPTPLSRCCCCCFCCLISNSEWQLHFCFRCCVRFLMMFPLATRVHAKTHIKQVEKKKLLFVLATCECVWISAVWLRNIFGESATFITFMNVVGCRLFFFFFVRSSISVSLYAGVSGNMEREEKKMRMRKTVNYFLSSLCGHDRWSRPNVTALYKNKSKFDYINKVRWRVRGAQCCCVCHNRQCNAKYDAELGMSKSEL